MLGYLYKELKTNKLILGVMFGLMMFFNVCPFASATGDDKPEGAFFYAVFFIMSGSSYLVIGMCASGLVQTDERKKWGYYNAAAPNGIRMQVGSIYIIILFALVCCFCISWAINTIMRKMSANVPNVTGMMIAMALLVLLLRAIELPFFYAFGSRVGGLVKTLLVFIVIFAVALYFLFADLSWLGSQDEVVEKIFEFLSSISAKKLWNSILGKILISAVPLYFISYFISTKVYLRGIDRLEK